MRAFELINTRKQAIASCIQGDYHAGDIVAARMLAAAPNNEIAISAACFVKAHHALYHNNIKKFRLHFAVLCRIGPCDCKHVVYLRLLYQARNMMRYQSYQEAAQLANKARQIFPEGALADSMHHFAQAQQFVKAED